MCNIEEQESYDYGNDNHWNYEKIGLIYNGMILILVKMKWMKDSLLGTSISSPVVK